MLCIGITVLLRFGASKTKGVEADKELDPSSSTSGIGVRPRFPGIFSDVAVYISGEAVGKGVREGAVEVVSHVNISKVNEVVGAVGDSAVDEHFRAGVVAMSSRMRFPSGFPLSFFSSEYRDDDLVNVGHPLPVQSLTPK